MSYPATYDVQSPERIANWRPLVHWLLAIPHFIIVYILNLVASVVGLISWFAILFTGALPEGLAQLQCMAMRYQLRAISFAAFLHEDYPPFDFTTTPAEPGGTPVSVSFEPALTDRDRLSSGLRIIWAIPAVIFGLVVMFVAELALIVAFFAVLFTGRWPEGIHGFVVKALDVWVRMVAYVWLLTDEYPPFSLDRPVA
jgi:Domain of unknown function (DUF4389)